jgi:hypothetical protein
MTGLERTTDFLAGKVVDRRPFHPIIIRWAARYAGIKYRDFCTDYPAKCEAMIRCADDFDLDWVTVMSDAYCEASAFGLQIEYPEDSLPIDAGGHLPDLARRGAVDADQTAGTSPVRYRMYAGRKQPETRSEAWRQAKSGRRG